SLSGGAYFKAVVEAQQQLGSTIAFHEVRSWHVQPAYLEAVAKRVNDASQTQDPEIVIFTAHSLPKRILQTGDPYVDQLRETANKLASRLALPRWQLAFQSAGMTGEPWLDPD